MRHLTTGIALCALLLVPALAGASTRCETDADCGSFELCFDGLCAEVEPTDVACETDDDCILGPCWDGLCWEPIDEPVPPLECETDEDCLEGEYCFDGVCVYEGGGVEDCASDADCGEGEMCLWGMCWSDDEGACRENTDCGYGEVCLGCFCEDSTGLCQDDGDCGEFEACLLMGDEDVPAAGEACAWNYGWCVVDADSVPVDPRCESFCAIMERCGGSGEGSGEATEGVAVETNALEEDDGCLGYCSYTLAMDDSDEAAAALIACWDEHVDDTCEEILEECTAEAEALVAATSDDTIWVEANEQAGTAQGSGDTDTDGSPATDERSLGGALADMLGVDQDDDGGSLNDLIDKATGGNCAAGGSGSAGALGLLFLLGLAVVYRRRSC